MQDLDQLMNIQFEFNIEDQNVQIIFYRKIKIKSIQTQIDLEYKGMNIQDIQLLNISQDYQIQLNFFKESEIEEKIVDNIKPNSIFHLIKDRKYLQNSLKKKMIIFIQNYNLVNDILVKFTMISKNQSDNIFYFRKNLLFNRVNLLDNLEDFKNSKLVIKKPDYLQSFVTGKQQVNSNVYDFDGKGILIGDFIKVFTIDYFNFFFEKSSLKNSIINCKPQSYFKGLCQEISELCMEYFQIKENQLFNIIFIEGIQRNNNDFQQDLVFSNYCLIDSEILAFDDSPQSFYKCKREIMRIVSKMILFNSVFILEDLHQDQWIFNGVCNYIAQKIGNQNQFTQKIQHFKYYQKLLRQIKKCEELWPLSGECLQQELKIIDPLYHLKSFIVVSCLLSSGTFQKTVGKSILQAEKLNFEQFQFLLKNTFGLKNVGKKLNWLVQKTGCPSIDLVWVYNRKENKIELELFQSPLSYKKFQKQTQERSQQMEPENYYQKIQSINKIVFPQYINSQGNCLLNILLIVSETNDIDYSEESHNLSLPARHKEAFTIYCRSKFRKTIQKKVGEEEDSEDEYFFEGTKKSNYYLNQSSRVPSIWVKIDPNLEYLREINENIDDKLVLHQLTKEKEPFVFLKLLQKLDQLPKSPVTTNTLCSLLEMKELHENLKCELIIFILRYSDYKAGWKGLDVLFNTMKSYFYEKQDIMYKLDFTKYERYQQILSVIRGLRKIPEKDSEEFSNIVGFTFAETFFKMLQQMDNSVNIYDNSVLKAEILATMLNFDGKNINQDILNFLENFYQEQETQKCYQRLIERKFLKNINFFFQFCKENNDFEISQIHKLIKYRFQKDQQNIFMLKYYFRYQFYRKLLIKNYTFNECLHFFLNKFKQQDLSLIIIEEYFYCYIELFKKIRNNYELSVQSLQQEITSLFQISLVLKSDKIFLMVLKLQQQIYSHYNPNIPENTEYDFPIDVNILREDIRSNINSSTKKKNIIKLQYLSLTKKRKSNSERKVFDCRELILNSMKVFSDGVSWKSLAKAGLAIITSERNTERVENENFSEEIQNPFENQDGFVIKLKTPVSLKYVKKKMNKGQYSSVEEVEKDLLQVVDNYEKNKYMSEELLKEFRYLITEIFREIRGILVEKEERDEEKMKKIKIVFKEKQND